MLTGIRTLAQYPERLDRLIEIVEADLGYHLHRAVQKTKMELSRADATEFVFESEGSHIRRHVTRSEFESGLPRTCIASERALRN